MHRGSDHLQLFIFLPYWLHTEHQRFEQLYEKGAIQELNIIINSKQQSYSSYELKSTPKLWIVTAPGFKSLSSAGW